MASRTKWIWSLGLSFAVYLFPLIGPHTVTFLAELIWREISRREREPLWMAADIGFALFLQLSAFLLIYWVFSKPGIPRALVLAAAGFCGFIGAEYSYLVFIPSIFLIENDRADEKGNWSIECAAPAVSLVDVPHPAGGLVWSEFLVQAPDGGYKLMRVPGCELAPLLIPQARVQPGGHSEFVTSVNYFVPGHGIIFSRQETATGAFTWNYLFGDRITSLPGLHPTAFPILSVDGEWAAWLERDSLAIERIDGSEAPLQIPFGDLKTWAYMLRTVDMQREEIELFSRTSRVVLGLDGKIKSSGAPPFAWDVYRDDGAPYQVSWNLNGLSGMHNALKGRSISSAAATPSGDLIAVSVSTALNIGRIRDSLYVLRASDGSEVFRRYLPTYTRTPVYFPTNDLMVYTGDRQVIVLRVQR